MFDDDPLCDICNTFVATEELDLLRPNAITVDLYQEGDDIDWDEVCRGELLCVTCFGALSKQRYMLKKVTSVSDLKATACGSCPKSKRRRIAYCRKCAGTGVKLTHKSPLERLADMGDPDDV